MKKEESAQVRGGRARAAALSPEHRRAICQAAAIARWTGAPPLKATHQGDLNLSGLQIPCYVLENGKRILARTQMVSGLGMKEGGNQRLGKDRLANFIAGKRIFPFVQASLAHSIKDPIRFRIPNGSVVAYGFEATALVDLCEVVLTARQGGHLQLQQMHIADRCELIVRALSRVGIVALVDEATGYQADRARDALAKILEAYIATELRKWVRTFPSDYYKEMFRLRGWKFGPTISNEKPPIVGKLTNSIVYSRLAPGVLDELRRVTPRDHKGRLKHRFHQHLTDDIGHPKLREHLVAVIVLMRAFTTWGEFIRALDRSLPKYGHTFELPLGDGPQAAAG